MPEPASRLPDADISERLRSLRGWEIKGGKLSKAFQFADFMGAVGFVNRVAAVAEAEGHHPDLQVGWGRVVVELTSHDAGGLTARDFNLAALIEKL
jgi:4a-hydroxytetrahydrobiopterin dehydratase